MPYGSTPAEAFMITAIVTILITRLLLHLAGYPQVGGGRLHIAHALYGGALMMFALLLGWMFLGFGVRAVCVVAGGIGFGLFLDDVGKFVTKNNDYFYGPAAEIMYISVALLLVLARVVRDVRPPSVEEKLANAAIIAAEGIARGLPPGRREWAFRMLADAHANGGNAATIAGIRTLLEHAHPASARLHAAQRHAIRLIPGFFKSRHVVPVLGWLMVAVSALSVGGGWLSGVLGTTWYQGDIGTFEVGGHERRHDDPAGQRVHHPRAVLTGHAGLAPDRPTLATPVASVRSADLHDA